MRTIRPSAYRNSVAILACLMMVCSCDDNNIVEPDDSLMILADQAILNPYIISPLTARIALELSDLAQVRLTIRGKSGAGSDIVNTFDKLSAVHEIPVLGLYPDYNNTVVIELLDKNGALAGSKTYTFQTIALLPDLPSIETEIHNEVEMSPGMTLVNYYGHNGSVTPQRPFMFDRHGEIRWYLDFRSNEELRDCFYDVGPHRLQNGNLYFGNAYTSKIYELTMLGEVVNSWPMPGFGFHHNVQEKPNGNFLVTVNRVGASTVEDHIIEIDRNTGEIINVWDLRESLDPERTAWTTDAYDWIHVNSVHYDESDHTIIVSGRTQALVKLNYDNQLVWILSPHAEWDNSGNGTDLSQFLLQPLDAAGSPITNPDLIQGVVPHPDFEWPWYQHAARVLPNGHITCFDNGFRRNFSFSTLYSRAVEYEIDAENMTVRQIWSYGKERGEDTFARIVSDADFRLSDDRVFFSPGAVTANGNFSGKVIELTYTSKQVLFEATIIPPLPAWDITFHRTERLRLYH